MCIISKNIHVCTITENCITCTINSVTNLNWHNSSIYLFIREGLIFILFVAKVVFILLINFAIYKIDLYDNVCRSYLSKNNFMYKYVHTLAFMLYHVSYDNK